MSATQNRLASACLSQTPRFGRINLGVDHPREACGVWAPGEPVANLAHHGLSALRHRGQTSAGMAGAERRGMLVYREMGLVRSVIDEATLAKLQEQLASGIALAHGGNLTNTAALAGRRIPQESLPSRPAQGLCSASFTGGHPIPTPDAALADLRPSTTAQPPTFPLPNPEPEVAR